MLRISYFKYFKYSMLFMMGLHLPFSKTPLLAILSDFKFWHFPKIYSTSTPSSPPFFCFPTSIMTSPTSSRFYCSLSRSFNVKILFWVNYFSLFTLFYILNRSSMMEASCWEKAKADSEKDFVCWEAFFTWRWLWALSSSACGQLTDFYSVWTRWYF